MCLILQDNRMKCDLPGLYVQPRGGVKGLRDGRLTISEGWPMCVCEIARAWHEFHNVIYAE